MSETIFFITGNCSRCKACLPVCPAQCIYFGLNQYVIDADRCVGCSKCKSVCADYAIETRLLEEDEDAVKPPPSP